jgi:hypothetical protein
MKTLEGVLAQDSFSKPYLVSLISGRPADWVLPEMNTLRLSSAAAFRLAVLRANTSLRYFRVVLVLKAFRWNLQAIFLVIKFRSRDNS